MTRELIGMGPDIHTGTLRDVLDDNGQFGTVIKAPTDG